MQNLGLERKRDKGKRGQASSLSPFPLVDSASEHPLFTNLMQLQLESVEKMIEFTFYHPPTCKPWFVRNSNRNFSISSRIASADTTNFKRAIIPNSCSIFMHNSQCFIKFFVCYFEFVIHVFMDYLPNHRCIAAWHLLQSTLILRSFYVFRGLTQRSWSNSRLNRIGIASGIATALFVRTGLPFRVKISSSGDNSGGGCYGANYRSNSDNQRSAGDADGNSQCT